MMIIYIDNTVFAVDVSKERIWIWIWMELAVPGEHESAGGDLVRKV